MVLVFFRKKHPSAAPWAKLLFAPGKVRFVGLGVRKNRIEGVLIQKSSFLGYNLDIGAFILKSYCLTRWPFYVYFQKGSLV